MKSWVGEVILAYLVGPSIIIRVFDSEEGGKRRGQSDVMEEGLAALFLALKEEGDRNQGVQVASRQWTRRGSVSPSAQRGRLNSGL